MKNVTILQASHLIKTFGLGHTSVKAVDGISLTVNQGELVLITGPSGSGKTTLLSILGGLLKPTSGKVFIDGVDISEMDESRLPNVRARKVGFVFQAFNLIDALTVEENILFPAQLVEGGIKGARKRAQTLIDRLGLNPRRGAIPQTLSGGEKQRVAIARALINEPPLILADEPTGNLDSQSGQEVMMILHDIARDEGCSVLMVTHDPRVEEIADRILWLEDGKLSDRKEEEHNWVKDIVCGMRVDAWRPTFTFIHGSEKYDFCSSRCLERFKESPENYLSNEPID